MDITTAPPRVRAGTPGAHTARPATGRRERRLGGYESEDGSRRELIARPGPAGSVLVVDRRLRSDGEERLLAHLGADEPSANARLLAEHYLAEEPSRRRCRAVTRRDLLADPFAPPARAGGGPACARPDVGGHRLRELPSAMSIPQLRWSRMEAGAAIPVSVRETIARLESYEPVCAITRLALQAHEDDPDLSTTTLRAELTRVLQSPIVLNRGLREAVLARVADGVSMSAIAMRCGRTKRARGAVSGETSWLARRIGLLAEGGQQAPTPWVHSDVLGLIARRGLGISPREVELG